MNSNVKEYKEIESLSKSLGAVPNINVGIIPRKDGSLLPLRHDLSFENVEAYFTEKGESTNSPKVDDVDPLKRLLCKAGKAVCSISPEGEVSPCLLMPIKLGSLREKTMFDIWYQQGNELLDKVRTPTAYDSSPCLNCNLLPFCVRCPGVAYLETGDAFGRSPTACRYAKWRVPKTNMKGGNVL
jgi:radical SAM protein with 4Fe4S-binding SPASM domain